MNIQIDDAERDEIFQRLRATPENNKCFDCDKKNPKWSSVSLGLYLCLDCAGKHREYGPQISFVRSLNLDTWNKKYITSMELGGNPKALEYFKKQGLKAPYDYKGAQIQKYKQDLAKKVDAALAGTKTEAEANKPVFTKPVEEEKTQPEQSHHLSGKSHSDKPTHGEKANADDPFANNIVINKAETKTKGFTVEFNKNKPTFGNNKGRIAAKKIDNVDLDALTLNEDGGSNPVVNKNTFDMTDNSLTINTKTNVKEVVSKGNSPYIAEGAAEEKFKKFSNAKAISSDSFNNENKNWEPSKVRQFAGSKAISSAQYFGDKEEEDHQGGVDYYQTAENVKDFLSHYGNKLKEKADGIVNKLKDEWQQ